MSEDGSYSVRYGAVVGGCGCRKKGLLKSPSTANRSDVVVRSNTEVR